MYLSRLLRYGEYTIMLLIFLFLSLFIILLSCSIFTNSIEWLGKRLNVGDYVVGSLFSAVGTCLPETMVPILAIFFTINANDGSDIGIGAIIGAPFMLSTLAFFITGIAVIAFRKKRKSRLKLLVDKSIIERDMGFFLLVYSAGIFTGVYINDTTTKSIIAICISIAYIFYVAFTIKNDALNHLKIEELFIAKLIKIRPRFRIIILQLIFALIGILYGAHRFVGLIEDISVNLQMPPLILSLFLVPIATELPEKFNSVMWISRNRDTLALGNITGAMVFQSCIPVSIGILATPWKFNNVTLISAILTFSSALILYLSIKYKRKIDLLPLLLGGLFYFIYLVILLKYILEI